MYSRISRFIIKPRFNVRNRFLSSYPAHELVGMPALSPTMEAGTVGQWLVKEGESFSTGDAICEIETDKAAVTFDATDDGYLAKILAGDGEIKVGDPLMILVEEEDDVSAFTNYVVDTTSTAAVSAPAPSTPSPAVPVAAAAPTSIATPIITSSNNSTRVFASPLARKLARDAGIDILAISSNITGTGPNNRIIAGDVLTAIATGATTAAATAAASTDITSVTHTNVEDSGIPTGFTILPTNAVELAEHLARTKQEVPHYYLTVEIDMNKVEGMRSLLNSTLSEEEQLGTLDFIVKAAGGAMKAVPDVNGEWKDSFVRQYDQVDINLIMSAGSTLTTPVIRDVSAKGVKSISDEIRSFEDAIYGSNEEDTEPVLLDSAAVAAGTFSIHNLGKLKNLSL